MHHRITSAHIHEFMQLTATKYMNLTATHTYPWADSTHCNSLPHTECNLLLHTHSCICTCCSEFHILSCSELHILMYMIQRTATHYYTLTATHYYTLTYVFLRIYSCIRFNALQHTVHASQVTATHCNELQSLCISARPYESCKIFKGRPRRNAFSKQVHRQYKSFPPDRFCQLEIKKTTGFSNKHRTA